MHPLFLFRSALQTEKRLPEREKEPSAEEEPAKEMRTKGLVRGTEKESGKMRGRWGEVSR